jgi:hypothetical protein
MRMTHRIAIATLVLTFAAPVSAQTTAIRYNEGPGVKLSDSFVFHPGVAVETRYDSNPLATNSDASRAIGGGVAGAAYLRMIAHLHLATTSAQRLEDGEGRAAPKKVQFRIKSAFAYRQYLTDDTTISDLSALEIDAGLNLKLSPARMFQFEILDDYERRISPRNQVILPGGGFSNETINLNLNRAMARAHFIPGGGRLSFALAYALNLRAYEGSDYSENNKIFHELSLVGKYLLLPKTALLLEVNQQFYNYYNNSLYNENSTPLRVYAGFSGLITPRLSTQIKVGYGNAFYDSGDSFSGVLALVELGYQIGPVAKARLGYQRNFEDSPYSNYVAFHKVYAGYDHVLINRLILHLGVDYAYRQYEGFDRLNANGIDVTALDPNLVTGSIGLDYQIQDWIYVGVGYDLQLQELPDDQQRADSVNVVSYVRHQVYGKVGVSY